ncbi:mitochondrial carrier domain-containing protein [Aspergillus karnatakaensis]|uniref:mitochondrial carrier domain-containing protein n=1 Tax=Aspergillus karnatakaensis TaxID=1810916 RepID=UPI003CCDA219
MAEVANHAPSPGISLTPTPTNQTTSISPSQPQLKPHQQIKYPLWFGGSASCIAVAVSHPLDLIKVRMQMASTETQGIGAQAQPKIGPVGTAVRILRTEGVRGLYAGFSAGFMRQLTYGTTRIATYESLKCHFLSSSQPQSPLTLTLLASLSGTFGAIPGNASDLANTRMQNDSSLPSHLRRNYKNVLDAWRQMYVSEGILFWTKGLAANALRCGVMTGCQLGSYDYFKSVLSPFALGDTVTQGGSSVLAAFVATSVASPVDVVKTRLMGSSSSGASTGSGGAGGGAGKGVVAVIAELMKREGLWWVVRGWVPSFVRLGPQTVVTLVMLEEHRRVYRRFYLDIES